MKPIDQKVVDLGKGDCFAACVASVLELTRDDVPNFMEGPPKDMYQDAYSNWYSYASAWLREHGYTLEVRAGRDEKPITHFPTGYWIASGQSPRKVGVHHAVVYCDDEMVHDPHPSRDGIVGRPLHSYVIKKKVVE